ncbi:TetR family transcriptional regulator [Streptomyces tropicalis]|uniref:TetR family transcriptional regulator n=1 Tax=Streptomyces tropicalis TaxID=3034234 RepID=A0ABT6AA13_9ACTN|nr:TetR family transcriptional regulator [Streptomyces tropicalis]MDF3301282.1 TetR family transcriptional regulator [Streptomyces tropicalis]
MSAVRTSPGTPAATHPDAPGTSAAPAAPGDPGEDAAQAGPGRRDAEATKAAILRAARHFLARQPHAHITLKAVADRAGVSPPLVLKYFGSKDALFARVMSFEDDTAALLDAPLDALGRHMVRQVLESQRDRGADPVLRIVFAPLHGAHGEVLRANFRAQVTERLAARLTGPDTGVRAELAVAALLGLGVMYGLARGPHVRDTAVDDLVERYAPAVQAHLTP